MGKISSHILLLIKKAVQYYLLSIRNLKPIVKGTKPLHRIPNRVHDMSTCKKLWVKNFDIKFLKIYIYIEEIQLQFKL